MDKKRSTHQFWKLTGIFIETFIVNNIVLIQALSLIHISVLIGHPVSR